MTTILILGLLIGMQHALEADHIAAVATISARQSSIRKVIRHGAVWGIGHTLTLMLFAGAALYTKVAITKSFSAILESCIGILLIGLGGHLLYRLWKNRVHFHAHRHQGGVFHFHAHSHQGDSSDHAISPHDHDHPAGLPIRTLVIGMMHGLAGSAALLVLTATAVNDTLSGIAYIAMFGIGSIIGMVILSALIAVPLSYSARMITWANRGLQGLVGCATVALGGVMIVRTISF
tara:strand:+ start:906 stop:1607 length:702 start_codon:yes stop_codon:yes gene_type:complete